MINIKDHKQTELFDPRGFLSPRRRQIPEESWAGFFREEILPELPVGDLIPFFTSDFGRPSKELYTILGTLLFQQTFDLTDEETISQLAFNIQWHYALNITEESDSAKYMCLKTLWKMRSILADSELCSLVFENVAEKLVTVFKVNTENQRIDSVHVKSNMCRLGRIRIFSQSIHKFPVSLKRGHNDFFETVDNQVIEKYLPEKSLRCFSMIKPSESHKTLKSVSRDLFDLVQQFKGCPEIISMHSYKLPERVLEEHCYLTETDGGIQVEIKKPEDIPSDSLQNPSDPDAGYSGHKGQGCQVQIMETCSKDDESEENKPNIITYADAQPAHESDANALIPAPESTRQRNVPG